jgi:ribosomal protein S27E
MKDLEEVLEEIGLDPVDKGQYYLIRCPSCGRREMFLYKSSRKMICNRRNKCGAEINLEDFLRENQKLSIENVEVKSSSVPEKKELVIPEGVKFFSEPGKGFAKKRALRYLLQRNIPKNNIKRLGYIYEPGNLYNNTIFFPFWENNKIVYFTTRVFTGNRAFVTEDGERREIRYIAAKGINSHDFVYNIDEIKEDGDLFIFEGLMDALSLENQIGTATMTSTLGDKQAIKIWDKAPGRIILVPDNDKTGRDNLIRNYRKLLFHRPPSLNNTEVLKYSLPEGVKDFNETGKHFIDINECDEIKKGAMINIAPW